MADFSKYISYFRGLRLRAPGPSDHPGAPLPGSQEHGAYLADFAQRVQQAFTAIEQQTNASTTSEPQAPPNIQSLDVRANNGHFTFAITDQSAQLRRGVSYFIEHADNPGFVNAHTIELGQTRNHQEFFGNASRYFRAYSAYPGSPASEHVYFGGQATPRMASGGGAIPAPEFLASQGSGTSAAGQSGTGPGPVQARTERAGFDWRLQRPIQGATGFDAAGTPAGDGALASSGGGGGGGGIVTDEAIIASCEWLTSVTGTNTIAAVTATPYQSLAAGFLCRFVPANTNSGAVTLNVNSIGATAVTKNGTTALAGGELVAGRCYLLLYDGTNFQIVAIFAPISATLLASDSHGVPSVAVLTSAHIFVGDGSNLPADVAMSGDASLANTGALTLADTAVTPNTYGDATNVGQFTVDSKGRLTFAQNVPITFPGTSGFSGTVALAALTTLGTQGSLTVANGLITAYTPPT